MTRRLVSLVCLVNVLAACERTTPAPLAPHPLHYRLAWSDAGTTPIAGGGFEVTTDLGYRVRTTRGWVVTETMAFLECHREELASSAGHPRVALLAPATAEAGHSLARMNPARLANPQVESLVGATTLDAGTVTPPSARYCNVHYLVARAAGDTHGLPSEVDMLGASLQVDGSWQAPNGGDWHPFSVRSAAANGIVAEVPALVDTATTGATATVERALATLYDGVDFAQASEAQEAWQILKNLIASTELRVVSDGRTGSG